MEVYETEEQQIEAVKKWWKENGMSLIFGAAIGLASVGGWKYFQETQNTHGLEASDMYMSLVNLVASNSIEESALQGEQLANNYADTPYAALASLVLAKQDYEHGKIQAAISKLSWAKKNANDVETQQVATTRLIRVYLSEGMLDEAEALINMPHPVGFDAIYAELNGDLLTDKNEFDKARMAYDSAISLSGDDVSQWLKLKRNNLGR